MARTIVLCIVHRDERRLYDYLTRTFAGTKTVEVISDRRAGERRRAQIVVPVERREVDRRLRTVARDLLTMGYAWVTSERP